jgi:tetratricopeptide (TPR) repeat protein
MTARLFAYVTALILSGSLLTGCSPLSSQGSTRHQIQRGALTPVVAGRKVQNPDVDLEKRIRTVALYATGLVHELNEQHELALEQFLKAAEIDPGNETIAIEAAQRCIRAQKADKAVELLSKATALPNASGALYAWLGLAHAEAGQLQPAIAANRMAIRKMPHALIPYQNLAQIYLQNSLTNEALQVLDEAARQPATNPGFLIELAEIYLRFARAHSTTPESMKTRVHQLLDRASDLNPTTPLHLLRLADGYYAFGELLKAEPFYLQLLEAHSDLPSIRGKLAEIYLRSGQKEKAVAQLETLARDDPANPQTYIVLGAIAMETRNLAGAAENFERALRLAPDIEQIYYELAGIKLSLKQAGEALDLIEKARARFKISFLLEFYTGIIHSALKNYEQAFTHLVSAEVLARANEPARLNHLFYFQLGAVCERNGNIEEAEKQFRKCLQLAPDYAEALNYLGYMWAEHGVNLHEARELIEKALKIEPDNSAFLDSMAWVLHRLNLSKQALDYQLKALEKAEEPDPVLYDHLGDIYAALEKTELARESWQKALDLEPNDDIARKLQADPSQIAPRE